MAKTKVDENTQEAVNQLKSLTQATLSARGTDRQKLDTQMADIRSRIQLLQAMSANYQNLLGFARIASADPDRATNLAALVENLERAVPDVSSADAPSQTWNTPAPWRAPYGIMGMISPVATIGAQGASYLRSDRANGCAPIRNKLVNICRNRGTEKEL